MHPQRDQLLRDVICRASCSEQLPADISAIDSGWQLKELLARVAAESREGDWSPEVAAMIGKARVQLARSDRIGDLGAAVHWETSNCQVRDALVDRLADALRDSSLASLGVLRMTKPFLDVITGLATSPEDKRQARGALLRLLMSQTSDFFAVRLITALTELDPTADDKRRAREMLLGRMADQTRSAPRVKDLAEALAQLKPTMTDKSHACSALIRLVQADSSTAEELMAALVLLDPTAEDKRRAREVLLRQLTGQADREEAESLAAGLVLLDPTAEDKRRAREVLLRQLPAKPIARRPRASQQGWSCLTRRRRTSAGPARCC